MPNIELFKPLLELSAAISTYTEELQTKPEKKRKSELKEMVQKLEEALLEQSTELIKRTVDSWDSDQPLSDFLVQELDIIKKESDESWHLAIDDVKIRLRKISNKESKKSPTRRKIEKNWWWLIILFVGITMVSLKWFWLINVNQPSDTVTGVIQRAGALEKILDYDDTMDTRVRRGGWLKGIILWPAEPTEKEIGYGGDFLWSTIGVYDYLQEQNAVCGVPFIHNPDDDNYKDEILIAQVVIDYINTGDNFNNVESGTLLIAEAFLNKFPCE
jgi:hypothetical protein